MGFADSIKAFEKKALLAANTSVNKAVESLFNEVVAHTPTAPEANYAKGLLINSYYTAVGGFDLTVGTATDYYGGASLSRIKSLAVGNNFLGKDNFVTLTNSVDHAYRADKIGWPMGEGSSGWHWTGKVGAYNMRDKAIVNWKGKYL